MSHPLDGPPPDEPPRPAGEVKISGIYERIVRFRSKYLAGQEIPSLAALMTEIEEGQRVLGVAAEQATKAVVEELESRLQQLSMYVVPL